MQLISCFFELTFASIKMCSQSIAMARKANRINLGSIEFSILHQFLLEKCFANLETPASLSDYALYGYNNGRNDTNSIRVKMLETSNDFKIDGRALSDAVKNYYANENISLPAGVVANCLNFLGFANLREMADNYFKANNMDSSSYELPVPLKYLSNQKKSKASPGLRARIDDKLENLYDTNWWCYSHFYSVQEEGRYVPKIQRIPFFIRSRLANGDYEVELKQKPPYTTFKGRIVRNYSGDNILACELTSTGKAIDKRIYMAIHVNLAASGTIFVGGMIRYTDNAAIRLSTFVMEKIQSQSDDQEPDIFDFNPDTERFIKPVILDFLYDRSRNVIKLPRNIYCEQDFKWWIQPQKDKSDRNKPEFDMMVVCPIRSLANEQKRIAGLTNELVAALKSSVAKSESWLREKIEIVLQQQRLSASSDFDLEMFRQNLLQMIGDIQGAQTDFNKIYCPLTDDNFKWDSRMDAGYRLEEQLAKFKSSRSMLMIFPFPVASGVLVEAGWAMFFEKKIPLFIVYEEIGDLPLLLRKADTLKGRRIFMTSLKEIGGIEGIADWISSSRFDRFLPEVR